MSTDYVSFLVRTAWQNLMLSVEAGNDTGCPSIDVVFLGFDDSSFVTGIELFGDDGIAQV